MPTLPGTNHSKRERRWQDVQPGKAGSELTLGARKQMQEKTSTERARSIVLGIHFYLHRDERIKEEKQEPTKTSRRERTFSKPAGQNP